MIPLIQPTHHYLMRHLPTITNATAIYPCFLNTLFTRSYLFFSHGRCVFRDDRQLRDGAASERYFERLSSVVGRAGNGRGWHWGSLANHHLSGVCMSLTGQATFSTSKRSMSWPIMRKRLKQISLKVLLPAVLERSNSLRAIFQLLQTGKGFR